MYKAISLFGDPSQSMIVAPMMVEALARTNSGILNFKSSTQHFHPGLAIMSACDRQV